MAAPAPASAAEAAVCELVARAQRDEIDDERFDIGLAEVIGQHGLDGVIAVVDVCARLLDA